MLNVRTFADMERAVVEGVQRLNPDAYDVVVGIPRSGMIPAALIATYLQLPLADVTGYRAGIVHGRSGNAVKPGNRVLLVDDTVNKGRAMARAVDQLPRTLIITRLCVFGPYSGGTDLVDIAFAECPGPRVFAWNCLKHKRVTRWGFDFDGVLCRDILKEENDDGPRYLDFLANVEPLFLPRRPIGHIITGRAERYRAETEGWLARHGVEFAGLHMTPFHTKAERMSAMKHAGGRGGWKAGIARELGVEMFVESCPKQARIIARDAAIPVWCTRTQSLA